MFLVPRFTAASTSLPTIDRAKLRAGGLLPERSEVDPEFERRLPGALVDLGTQHAADSKVQRLERLDWIHALCRFTTEASLSVASVPLW